MTHSAIHREVLDLTKKLIQIPSTHSRQEEIHRCADLIEQWLSDHSIYFKRLDINNVPSLLILPEPGKTPVLLMSHFDVVEVEDLSLFTPVEKDGRLYGRGAIDDKYAVAVTLVLFKEHLKNIKKDGGSQKDMKFGLLITGDEEVGGKYGAGKASESIETEFFIAIDGGSPEKIVCKEKGVIQLALSTTGKAAHGARPWLGESAFDILTEDYRIIQKALHSDAADHWHATAVLSNCKVGNGSTNSVPDKASAILDIRFTEHDDPDAIVEVIRSSIRSEVVVNAKEPVFISKPSPYIDLLTRHTNGAKLGFEHGASDARYLSRRGIPGVIYGAEGEMSQHTEEEHIILSSLYNFYDQMDSYLLDITVQARKN